MKKLTLTLLFAVVAVAMQAATIYLKIGEGQVTADSNIAVWIWNDSQNFTGGIWPGAKLTETKTVGDAQYFVYTVNTTGSYNLLFNNNGGGSQTNDIIDLQGDYTFVLNGWGDNNFTKTAGAPSETPVEQPVVKLYGDNYGKWAADNAVELTYNESTGEYTYTETTPANLAGEFKLSIDGKILYSTKAYRNKALSTTSDFQELSDVSNMVLTGCDGFDSATLTVKKSGDKWMLKIVGEKKETPVETHTVQILGEAYTWSFETAPKFTYNEETKEYVYIEETPANLAKHFKLGVDNTWRATETFKNVSLASATTDFVAIPGDIGYEQNMCLTDAADYKTITVTVKLDGDAWMVKIAGEKSETPVETVVKIKGAFNDWNLTELEGSDGNYTITVTENIKQLADGFGFEIDGVYYAGDIELELDGDAVVMTAKPGTGKNIRLANEGKYEIILTIAKDGSNWTVKAGKGKTSAVEAIDAENVNVVAGNSEIVVEGAQSVAVYTAAGALVSTDARTRVAAGLYIVRADNAVKKVIVK